MSRTEDKIFDIDLINGLRDLASIALIVLGVGLTVAGFGGYDIFPDTSKWVADTIGKSAPAIVGVTSTLLGGGIFVGTQMRAAKANRMERELDDLVELKARVQERAMSPTLHQEVGLPQAYSAQWQEHVTQQREQLAALDQQQSR